MGDAPVARPAIWADPRHYQIGILATLLVYGAGWLDFEIEAARAIAMVSAALATQLACTRLWRLPAFDPRSPLISGLSLCLLLRTNSLTIAVVAAVVTIASKFVVRWRGKHLFNPTNFGIVAMMAATGQVWVSPGQWGHAAFVAFLLACLGGLVVNRAARSDVTYAFAAFYLALVFGRSIWLGEPLAIPVHRLQSGALLVFTFFMISDPKTTPDSRAGRVTFAAIVAMGAFVVQFVLFRTNGPLWALALAAPLVPLIDRLLPGVRYAWASPKDGRRPQPTQGVTHHETPDVRTARRRWSRLVHPGRAGLLRLLRRQGRHPAVQPGLAGGAGPER